MTINELFVTNNERSRRWHQGKEWSPLEWAGAMTGEAGEAANAAKKLKLLQDNIPNINVSSGRQIISVDQAQKAICKEVADTIIYGLLLMAHCGCLDPQSVIREVFNAKSEEFGFPERL